MCDINNIEFNNTFSSILQDKIFNYMSKYSLAIVLLLFFNVVLSNTQALPQQPQKVAQLKYCGSMLKSQFIQRTQQYHPKTDIQNAIQNLFPADRDKLVQGVIEGNSGKFQESVRGNQGKYVVSLGILALLALLHVVLVPVLLVTRCCTRCCKFKVKKNDESYSPCELCWPGACIIFLLFALIGISAGILKVNTDFQPKYTDFKCSLGLTTHNILEGGSYDKNNIQFNGLKYFRSKAQNFFQNMSAINGTIQGNLTSKSKPMKAINHNVGLSFNLSAQIPDTNRWLLNTGYTYPFTIGHDYQTTSTLTQLLGSFGTKGTLVKNLTDHVRVTNKTIQQIAKSGDSFHELASRAKDKIQKQVSDSIYKMEQVEFNIINTVGITEKGVLRAYTIGSYVVLGFTIFMAAVLCLGVICLAFWNSYHYRKRVCFCCGVLWIIGILHFLLAIAFTLANPALLYGCQYAREGFASQAGFNKNFGSISPGSQASKTISKCLSSSTTPQYLYNSILTDGLKANLSQLQQSFSITFNSTEQKEEFFNQLNNLIDIVQKYRSGRILDVRENQTEPFKQMSKTHECMPDSWVPSIHQQEPLVIPCMKITPDMPNADNSTCPNVTQFLKRGVGCVGCMDTISIFEMLDIQAPISDMDLLINQRYPQCKNQNKSQITRAISYSFRKYFRPKVVHIGNAKARAQGVFFNSGQMYSMLSNQLEPDLKKVQEWFQAQQFLQDGDNSTIAKQMDCRILGKGIEDSVNIVCSEGMPFVYNLRFLYYATSIIIFLICCFSVCLMSRFYHQYILKSFAPNQEKYHEMKNVRLQPQAVTDRRESIEEMVVHAHPYVNH